MVDKAITSRFNEIYDTTYNAVLSFVAYRCKNVADIGDVVQETYVELYNMLQKRGVDYVQNEQAIALKIAKQKLSRYYSLVEKLQRLVPLFAVNDEGDEVPLTDLEADAFLAEDYNVNQAVLSEAQEMIAKKPDDVRKVLYLYYDKGLSIDEVAKKLSLTQSNVKNKLYRTLKELRKLLQE
ncbi:MAG: RNA polymerase sigma factor [Oscillospiraceae bacterium]|nr:RNA polymerase sigma factor [Oscillospiraceae bacterium]